MRILLPITAAIALPACQQAADNPESALTTQAEPYAGIAPEESVHYAGNEPFWSGVSGNEVATYATPENPGGTEFAVERFAGNNGIAIGGTIDAAAFDLTVTPGACSDGMSDRTYPFTATLLIDGEQRNGCAWTDSQPFAGPESP